MKRASRRHRWTHTRHYDWAKLWASLFEPILPFSVCESAMATCRFVILGKNANGNEYGKGFRTFMQTFGSIPVGLVNEIQLCGNWIELDAHESANLVLECFGLSVQDVYDHYGEPEEGDQLKLNLHDLVVAIDSGFALTDRTAVA